MPNWCSNTVIVDGKKREIARFVDYVQTEDRNFSFNAILPMPEELWYVISPTSIVDQAEYDKACEEHDGQYPITQEMSDRFMKQYGVDNWYDWANKNWGTKWELPVDDVFTSVTPTQLVYKFDTAWGPPIGIYEELVYQFPKLTFSWSYEEENMEVVGNLATDDLEQESMQVSSLTTLLRSIGKLNK